VPGQTFSGFVVARYVGITASATGTVSSGIYREDFTSDRNPPQVAFDSSGPFQHTFWDNLQPDGPSSPSDVEGRAWDLGIFPGSDGVALRLTGATDTITFPNLRPDVHVGFASVDVNAGTDAYVRFVGDNGTYTAHVGTGDQETVSAGESHVLQRDGDGNPTLELGPIREIVLDSSFASFDNVKLLVIPGQGPLDDFVTAAPGTPITIDLLDHANGAAADAALTAPLALVGFTQPSLPGGRTALSPGGNGSLLYTPGQVHGQHPIDTFSYTVQDVSGKRATATVYVTIDTLPVISLTHHFPYQAVGSGLYLAHGTAGPLTGDITLSDADGDPVSLVISAQAASGSVTLTEISATHYVYEYDPPTIRAYDPSTGSSRMVADIVGKDQFTLRAGDGIGQTDQTVQFVVSDSEPTANDERFIVPENVGVTYYPTTPGDPHYDPALARPGLVHFGAPGVLWNASDPDGDPLRAIADPANPPEHGVVQLLPDGSFNSIPAPGFTGTDRFGFYANDGYESSSSSTPSGGSGAAFVTIHVAPGTSQNPFLNAPVLLDDFYEVPVFSSDQETLMPVEANDDGLGLIHTLDPNDEAFWFTPVPPVHTDMQNHRVFDRLISLQLSPAYGGNGYLEYVDLKGESLHARPDEGSLAIDVSNFQSGRGVATFTYGAIDSAGELSNLATVQVILVGAHTQAVLPTGSSGSIVLQSPPETDLQGAGLSVVPAGAPADLDFTFGLLSFDVVLPPGENQTTVTISLPPGVNVTTYYKYTASHQWARFLFDPAHSQGPGAEFVHDPSTGQELIVLHLVDGGAFDDNRSAGIIGDPGGFAVFSNPSRNFVASLYEDVLGHFPTDAEMSRWVRKLDRGVSRRQVAQAVWNSDEHRRLQVKDWSMEFLGQAASSSQVRRWVNLLSRDRGEIAVEQAILTSPQYRRSHATTAAFLAGLNHDVLDLAGNPVDPSQGRFRRERGRASRGELARQFLESSAAAAILAQQDATTFLGRAATAPEKDAAASQLGRGSAAPAVIAESILASREFYNLVNSVLPLKVKRIRQVRSKR
jgi:hypothetical protein